MNVMTATTCGAACWYAREPVCRCSCGGENHGVLLKDGAEQPVRQRRALGRVFELVAVIIGYGKAHGYVRSDLAQGGWGGKAPDLCRVGDFNVQSAPKNAFKWPELKGFKPSRFFQEHPHLIWKRVG